MGNGDNIRSIIVRGENLVNKYLLVKGRERVEARVPLFILPINTLTKIQIRPDKNREIMLIKCLAKVMIHPGPPEAEIEAALLNLNHTNHCSTPNS